MSPSRPPLSQLLEQHYDEATVQRTWRGVVQRRGELARARRQRMVVAAGTIATAAVVLLVFGLTRSSRHAAEGTQGPLRMQNGSEISVLTGSLLDSDASTDHRVSLNDGSHLELQRGSRIEVVENSASNFVTLLTRGRVLFDVRPRGPRRWSIECGLATVEVVGTRFVVERDAQHVEVSVQHGVVLVRGERVPDRLRRLTAGEHLVLSADTTSLPIANAPAAPPPIAATPVALNPAPTAVPPPIPSRPSQPSSAWRELARRGSYTQAWGRLGAQGVASQAMAAQPEDLLLLADVARLSGHPADALPPLRRLLVAWPHDASAPVALFTIGRIELDALGHPSAAAAAFERAIALGIPRSLADDAAARLVEARARAGDTAGARTAAEAYAQQFPQGRHAADVRRWTSSP